MYVGCRIDHPTILIDFEVHMGTGRATGGTNKGYVLAFLDHITDFDQ